MNVCSVLISFSPIQQNNPDVFTRLYNSVLSSEDVIVAMSYPTETHCSLESAQLIPECVK